MSLRHKMVRLAPRHRSSPLSFLAWSALVVAEAAAPREVCVARASRPSLKVCQSHRQRILVSLECHPKLSTSRVHQHLSEARVVAAPPTAPFATHRHWGSTPCGTWAQQARSAAFEREVVSPWPSMWVTDGSHVPHANEHWPPVARTRHRRLQPKPPGWQRRGFIQPCYYAWRRWQAWASSAVGSPQPKHEYAFRSKRSKHRVEGVLCLTTQQLSVCLLGLLAQKCCQW